MAVAKLGFSKGLWGRARCCRIIPGMGRSRALPGDWPCFVRPFGPLFSIAALSSVVFVQFGGVPGGVLWCHLHRCRAEPLLLADSVMAKS